MPILGELHRARTLALSADETGARDLLLSLIPRIEEADRDDLMLEVFAQLGEIYLVRGANDGVVEYIRRIQDCLAAYRAVLPDTAAHPAKPDPTAHQATPDPAPHPATPDPTAHQATPDPAPHPATPDPTAHPATPDPHANRSTPDPATPLSAAEIAHMMCRYFRRAQFLETGLAAARGDHDGAQAALTALADADGRFPDLADEHGYLLTYGRILCAAALCDDDLHMRSLPLWEQVIAAIDGASDGTEFADHLRVIGGIGYGRFCVETGRLSEAEPWLRKAGARAEARGWELATARTQLERAAASWSARDHVTTEKLIHQTYPVIARYTRAHEVARCWQFFGLTRMGFGALEAANECFEHAQRYWRELGKPLHIHRILLQRSWIDIFRGRYGAAVELVAQAREMLDSWPRASWLQYAQVDNHLGTIWRADALADMGFDAAGDPEETWREAEDRQGAALGVTRAEEGSPEYCRAMTKFEQAAELKVPAALAVDAVRYSIADADARSRWAARVSGPMLAGAFAVAWEWENTELISELIEYHCARGTFSAEPGDQQVGDWADATAPVLVENFGELAVAAGGPSTRGGASLTRLGPLPPLQIQPDQPPILSHYRALASQRYGREVTAGETAWSTWP